MNALALALLTHPLLGRWASRSLLGLRIRGRRSGRSFTFPVQYAADADGLVVMPGHPESKRWWRNLITRSSVEVLSGGEWTCGSAWVLRTGDRGYDSARATYEARWPSVSMPPGQPLVRVVLDEPRRRR